MNDVSYVVRLNGFFAYVCVLSGTTIRPASANDFPQQALAKVFAL